MRSKTCLVCLLGLLLVVSSGCSALQGSLKPKAKLTNVHFDEFKGGALGLIFDVEIKNPYPVGVPLTGLAYSLSSDDKEFIAGSSEPDTVIPAGSEMEVALPVKVEYRQMWQALKGIRPGAVIPYNAELVLSMDTETFNTINLPLKKKGEIELPTISEAGLKKVWDFITK